jgi:transposase
LISINPTIGPRVLAFSIMKIVAAMILIVAALVSGHHWRMSPMTTGGATVNQPSTLPNGNVFEVAWARIHR